MSLGLVNLSEPQLPRSCNVSVYLTGLLWEVIKITFAQCLEHITKHLINISYFMILSRMIWNPCSPFHYFVTLYKPFWVLVLLICTYFLKLLEELSGFQTGFMTCQSSEHLSNKISKQHFMRKQYWKPDCYSVLTGPDTTLVQTFSVILLMMLHSPFGLLH